MLTEIWYRLNDSTQFFIIGICLLLIAGGMGYMRYIIHNARVRNRLRRIKEASKPVDYTQIDFTTYDSKARIKRMGHELKELTWRGGK